MTPLVVLSPNQPLVQPNGIPTVEFYRYLVSLTSTVVTLVTVAASSTSEEGGTATFEAALQINLLQDIAGSLRLLVAGMGELVGVDLEASREEPE